MKPSEQQDATFRLLCQFESHGIIHRAAEDLELDGRHVTLDGQRLLNFGSCSYLGLELDERLKQGAIQAIVNYGTQFSSSRAYLSTPLYDELTSLLDELFQAATVVTPSTTLGHLSALGVLLHENDAVILDQHVHFTSRIPVDLARQHGTHVEVLPHNHIEYLEKRIKKLRQKHRTIWYIADGVYSMHGDYAPMLELKNLLEQYESFHLYIDDAHGMSWIGEKGCGYAFSVLPYHPRMVVAVSLNKSFGAGGAAIVFPNAEWRHRVFSVGGPMIFSGPVQPASLGAAVASAKIHLSDEINQLQAELIDRVRFFKRLATDLQLPLFSRDESPTQFLGLGQVNTSIAMTKYLKELGFWINMASHPAVSARRTGVRLGITRHLHYSDLESIAKTFDHLLPRVLNDSESSLEEIRRAFKFLPTWRSTITTTESHSDLLLEHQTTIKNVNVLEWDRCFADRGVFTAATLELYETTFTDNIKPEQDWKFHYLTVRDQNGKPLIMTFFTLALWKDDMFSSSNVSRHLEGERRTQPYLLTSHVFLMGSLLSEGNHLYIDRTDLRWKSALRILLRQINYLATQNNAKTIALRDLPDSDTELDLILHEMGYIKLPMPASLHVERSWNRVEDLLPKLPQKYRYDLRRYVLPMESCYKFEIVNRDTPPLPAEIWERIYELYLSVQSRSYQLNTFPLPKSLFQNIKNFPDWEILLFKLKPEYSKDPEETIHAFSIYHISNQVLTNLVIGLDYRFVEPYSLYKIVLLQTLRRAECGEIKSISLGMGTETPKKRFGAVVLPSSLYVMSENNLSNAIIAELEKATALAN